MSRLHDVVDVAAILVIFGTVAWHLPKPARTATQTETVTREIRTLDGKSIECTRSEDHARGITSTSC